jgi:Big-like domain-containing protein
MPSPKSKLRVICAFAALATLALAASCRGFFVKPTLSSIVVSPPTPSIQTGSTNNTVQMSVFATFNDGSTGSTPVTWSISPTAVASISTSGLVTSVSTGTATITATATQNPSITGTQQLTVTVGCIQSITIQQPTTATLSPSPGVQTASFTALAATCNGSVDITDVATWSSSNTSLATVSAGVVTATQTAGMDGTVIITVSSGGVNGSNSATVTITGF